MTITVGRDCVDCKYYVDCYEHPHGKKDVFCECRETYYYYGQKIDCDDKEKR